MSLLKRAILAGVAATTTLVMAPTASAVVDGTPAPDSTATRATVALDFTDAGTFCTGTLIDGNWILTAAHCFTGQDKVKNVGLYASGLSYDNEVTYYTGEDNKGLIRSRIDIESADVVYSDKGSDMALVKLPYAISGVTPAKLASSPAEKGTKAIATGWGKGSTPTEGGLPLMSASTVIGEYADASDVSEINWQELSKYNHGMYYMSTYEKGNLREGDSGGPMIVNDEVTGVLSAYITNDQNSDQRAHHTSVPDNLDWIRKTIDADKPSQYIDLDTGTAGSGKIPFSIANIGGDDVADINFELRGDEVPVGAVAVIGNKRYELSEFTLSALDVNDGSASDARADQQRSLTVRVPVGLKPGATVEGYIEMPDNLKDGTYQVIAYPRPGYRPATVPVLGGSNGPAVVEAPGVEVVSYAKSAKATDVTYDFSSQGATPPAGDTDAPTTPAQSTDTVDPTGTADPTDVTSAPVPDTGGTTEPFPVDEPTETDPSGQGSTGQTSTPAPAPQDNDNNSDQVTVVVPDQPGSSNSVDLGHAEQPTQASVSASQPAANQRILADTGVKSMMAIVMAGFVALWSGALALRRRSA